MESVARNFRKECVVRRHLALAVSFAVGIGVIAGLGTDVPLGTEAADASNSADFLPPPGEPAGKPPDLSGPDCDNDAEQDAKDGGDAGEFVECYDKQPTKGVLTSGRGTKGDLLAAG